MENFESIIAEKYDLSAKVTHEFVESLELIGLDRNVSIVAKGEFNDSFYILKKGIVRAFIPVDGGEQTLWFGYPGQAFFDVWCYHYGSMSPISIETVIPCELYRIDKQSIENMCEVSLPVCNLVRKIFTGYLAEAEESFSSLFECDSGMERYLSILKRHPELLQNVPLNKLASYIFLTPQSLSRIRAQLRQ